METVFDEHVIPVVHAACDHDFGDDLELGGELQGDLELGGDLPLPPGVCLAHVWWVSICLGWGQSLSPAEWQR